MEIKKRYEHEKASDHIAEIETGEGAVTLLIEKAAHLSELTRQLRQNQKDYLAVEEERDGYRGLLDAPYRRDCVDDLAGYDGQMMALLIDAGGTMREMERISAQARRSIARISSDLHERSRYTKSLQEEMYDEYEISEDKERHSCEERENREERAHAQR